MPVLILYRLVSAAMVFAMNLRLSEDEQYRVTKFDQICARHMTVVNDIISWEKEFKMYKDHTGKNEELCSAVQIFCKESRLDIAAAKNVLWVMSREWERIYDELEREFIQQGASQVEVEYIKGVRYQMSGNEHWSKTTSRYN